MKSFFFLKTIYLKRGKLNVQYIWSAIEKITGDELWSLLNGIWRMCSDESWKSTGFFVDACMCGCLKKDNEYKMALLGNLSKKSESGFFNV